MRRFEVSTMMKYKKPSRNFITYAMVIAVYLICQLALSGSIDGFKMSRSLKGQLVPICVYIVMAVSLNLTVGISGELSLGHAGFMSVGAFSGVLISQWLLFAFAPHMVALFSSDRQVILLGTVVLRMVALSEPFYGVSVIIEGMLQGMGKTMVPFVCNICGMWGIRIIGTFLCTQLLGLGLVAAWGCMIAHNMLLFVLYSLYYRSGKWNNLRRLV